MSRFANVVEFDQNLNGTGLRVGVVMARFNLPVCEGLLSACIHELKRLGVADADMRIATVPGALEIPGAIGLAIESGRYDGYVAIGVVIRGETYHFEIVSNESCRALMDLAVEESLAIGNGILTVENEAQALERADPARQDKGGWAALAALSLVAAARRFGVRP